MKQYQGIAHYMRKFVSDKNGQIVLWQRPNAPILVWAAARLLQWSLNGRAEDFVVLVGTGALLVWATLELFEGVNYFRRLLGAVVLAIALGSIVAIAR